MKGENDMKKNEENIFLEDIEMPRIVEEKITETLLKIKMEQWQEILKISKIFLYKTL